MEIGGGDCALALSAATYVERVYAVDPADTPKTRRLPGNFRLVRGGGVAQESVDVAYSARATVRATPELRKISRALAPGGVFVCPAGPEYRAEDLRDAFLQAGFRSIGLYAEIAGIRLRVPFALRRLFRGAKLAAQK